MPFRVPLFLVFLQLIIDNEKLYFFGFISFLCQDKSMTEPKVGTACTSPQPWISLGVVSVPGLISERSRMLDPRKKEDLSSKRPQGGGWHRPHTVDAYTNIWFPLCSVLLSFKTVCGPLVWLSVKALSVKTGRKEMAKLFRLNWSRFTLYPFHFLAAPRWLR